MYQNELIHVIIGIKHDVAMHCEIGGTQGPLRYVSALGATRLVHWQILVAPSCQSYKAHYIMLKSLRNTLIVKRILVIKHNYELYSLDGQFFSRSQWANSFHWITMLEELNFVIFQVYFHMIWWKQNLVIVPSNIVLNTLMHTRKLFWICWQGTCGHLILSSSC